MTTVTTFTPPTSITTSISLTTMTTLTTWTTPTTFTTQLQNYNDYTDCTNHITTPTIRTSLTTRLHWPHEYTVYTDYTPYITYNPRQKSLKHLCTSLSPCNVEMLLQSCVAATTLRCEGGKQKGAEFSKVFQGFCLRLSEVAGKFRINSVTHVLCNVHRPRFTPTVYH